MCYTQVVVLEARLQQTSGEAEAAAAAAEAALVAAREQVRGRSRTECSL